MFATIEPWGPGWAVRDAADGLLIRRGFVSREEADRWSRVTDRSELRAFFCPSAVHWCEDYAERRGMQRIFAKSADAPLQWAKTRSGATLTIAKLFPNDGQARPSARHR